jgi:WD40 repeat protein
MRFISVVFLLSFLGIFPSEAQYYLNGKRTFSETGHQIYSVSYNTVGNYIVSVGYDNSIIIWNAESGIIYKTIPGLKKRPLAAVISANDSLLASGGEDNAVTLWDVKTSNVIKTFEGMQGKIKTLDFSPDGKYLAAGGSDMIIRIWEIETGKLLLELKGHKEDINVLKFSPDGMLLASGGADKMLIFWNLSNGSIIKTSAEHKKDISDLDFSADGKYLASCGFDNLILITELQSFTTIKTLKGHTDWIQTVDFSPDGKYLLSGGRDQIIILWDFVTGDILSKSEKQGQYVLSVDFCPSREDFISSTMMSEKIETWAFSGAVYANKEPSAIPSTKAAKTVPPSGKQVTPAVVSLASPEGKNYALLIGINEYESDEIPDLENPLKDAQSIYDVLTSRYTFSEENIYFLKNPKLKDLFKTFEELAIKLTPRDNLLIFYAGHGVWDEKNKLGYWFPADAERSSSFNWFRNSTLRDFIGSIHANHMLLVADACFGGAIFRTRGAGIPQSIQRLDELPSRKAMTSGILEEVPDESVFIKYLVKGLAENDQKYLTSELLFSSFKMTVIDNSSTVPQFGVIQNVGDEGGDFIFTLK